MKNIRCTQCGGKKKVLTLGLIEKNCTLCAGTGEIKCQADDVLKVEEEIVEKKGKTKK